MMHLPPSAARRPVLAPDGAAAAPGSAATRGAPELVATFTDPRQVTGIAVSPQGRMFVNFPRWEEDVRISVAEVHEGGAITPYPDAAWNAFRNAAPDQAGQRFVCVQSVVVDPLGFLWVLDPAAPGLSFLVEGGPKLVKIDLATNEVVRVYPFDRAVAPQGAYLNDIRFTPDGARAVLTDSGQPGALLAFDIASGRCRRVLSGHPSTQADPDFVITVRGQELRKLDGQAAAFNADSLALDAEGEFAYWQATSGKTLYRIAVSVLFDAALSEDDVAGKVERVQDSVAADGLWVARDGAFYFTSYEDDAVKRRVADGTFETVAQDARLFWPDSMAEGPDGRIYVTASHIPRMKTWQGPGVTQTELFRFMPR